MSLAFARINRIIVVGVGVALAVAANLTTPTTAKPARAAGKPPVFAYYYLWWSTQHWHDLLGAVYPYGANPLPLPANVDPAGCATTSRYSGGMLTDVPSTLESQDSPANIEKDVRQAAAAGLSGFVVNWIGTGSVSQNSTSNTYSSRLQSLVTTVHKVNTEGVKFTLLLSIKASSSRRTTTELINDMGYLERAYGTDTAFDHLLSRRLVMIWNGSRTYSTATLSAVAKSLRSRVAILGDETSTSWTPSRAASLDGDQYYWSSQDPVRNPQSFTQLRTLAAKVRASSNNPDGTRKIWLAPLTPGFDRRLLQSAGSCVPRRGGATLADLYRGNLTSNPDAFALISWNEITENTYIKPMRRYGSTYTDALRRLIG